MKKVVFDIVRRPDGSSEFEDFLCSLPEKDAAKLAAVIQKTEQYGLETATRQQWVKKLRDGIFELRSRQGGDIQRGLYFHAEGTRYLITHGFTKKTDRTPRREIEKAKLIRQRYQEGSDQS